MHGTEKNEEEGANMALPELKFDDNDFDYRLREVLIDESKDQHL